MMHKPTVNKPYFRLYFISLLSILLSTQSNFATVNHSQGPLTDQQLSQFLMTAEVIEIESTKLGITNPKRITLSKDGLQLRAVFKSFSTKISRSGTASISTQINRADRFENDLAAYELDVLLGLNMIPLAVRRRVNGRWGMVQIWIENAVVAKDVHDKKTKLPTSCSFKKQKDIMNVFDILILNDDRNLGNELFETAKCRLWMIDHSRSFRLKNKRPASLKRISIHMSDEIAEKLIALTKDGLTDKLKKYLKKNQIRSIIKRRDLIIESWIKTGKKNFRKN